MTASIAQYAPAAVPGLIAVGACLGVLPWLDRHSEIARRVLVGLSLVLMARYLVWRWSETLPPLAFSLDFAVGLTFLVVETFSLVGGGISWVFLTRTKSRTADVEANLEWLARQPVLPRIDVFICTYNEEAAILERTMIGALALDYPNRHVWVLDDGRREWLGKLCEQIGCGYITRSDNAHAKAGNINHALRYLAERGAPLDYIAILDADFVPFPNFLTRTLTLFREDDVGVVQTPQHFANPDPMQTNLSLAHVWPDEQRYFFDVVMASKDAWGAAFCCGTSSVIRYSALKGIGGFPTDSVTEDYLLTMRLQQSGFRTVYLNERLSLGLAPEGLKEYVVQRSRWCLGFTQIFVGRSGPLRTNNGLRLIDRIVLTETFLHWSASHAYRVLGLLIPIAYLVFGIEAVHADAGDALSRFAPFFVLQICGVGWLSGWRCLPVLSDLSALLAANEILKSVYRGLTKPLGQKFQVTAKGGDRSRRFVQTRMLAFFLSLLALTCGGVIKQFVLDPTSSVPDSAMFALFWSWYNIIVLVLACLVCIEQPRLRKSERFSSEGQARLAHQGREFFFAIKDVSTGGVALRGRCPLGPGEWVWLEFGEVRCSARIARAGADEFALTLSDDFETRAAMIRSVYSGEHRVGVTTIEPRRVALEIARRIFT